VSLAESKVSGVSHFLAFGGDFAQFTMGVMKFCTTFSKKWVHEPLPLGGGSAFFARTSCGQKACEFSSKKVELMAGTD